MQHGYYFDCSEWRSIDTSNIWIKFHELDSYNFVSSELSN